MALGGSGPTILVVAFTQSILGLVFVGLRFWARIRLLGGLRSDDHILWLAQLCLMMFSMFCIVAAFQGMGKHSSELTLQQTVRATKLITIGQSFNCIGIAASKSAVADFLLKIVVARSHKIILWACIVSVTILSLITAIGLYTQCTPLESIWNPSVPGKCHFSIAALGTALASYSAFMDFFLAALPWYFLRNLQMKPQEKLIINLALSSGVLAGICSTIRVTKANSLSARSDYTYEVVILEIWSTTELTVSIICVCVPALRPLYRRFVKGLSSSDSGGISKHGYRLNEVPHTGNETNTFTVTAGRKSVVKHSQQADNQSSESILGEEFRMQHGIRQTTTVVVGVNDQATDKSLEV